MVSEGLVQADSFEMAVVQRPFSSTCPGSIPGFEYSQRI